MVRLYSAIDSHTQLTSALHVAKRRAPIRFLSFAECGRKRSGPIMGWNIAKWTLIFLFCLGNLSQVTEGKVLWVGETGEVSCTVTGAPSTVGFTKQVDNSPLQLVVWSPEQGVTTPFPDRYDMTVEGTVYTMVIYDVSLSDADTYTCFWSLTAGSFNVNQTGVKVFDAPNEPFPRVSQCPPTPPPSQGSGQEIDHCVIVIANETDMQNLTCSASGFYPNATLKWSVAGIEQTPIAESWTPNSDGTGNMESSIEARLNTKPYICTISGLPIKGESKSFRVMVQLPAEDKSTTISPTTNEDKDPGGGSGNSVGLWVGIALVVVVGIVVVIVVLYKMWPRISESFSPQQSAF